MAYRVRDLSHHVSTGTYFRDSGLPVGVTHRVTGRQATLSQSNPWPSKKGSGEDVGSEFETTKTGFKVDVPCYADALRTNSRLGYYQWYKGPLYSSNLNGLNRLESAAAWTTNSTLNGMGATAISRVLPTNPATDAMVFAAELASDGIPKAIGQSLWKNRKNPIKGLADENLNYQFGLAPTISDTMSLVDTVSKSEKILKQYERDSGRNIRRQYSFPTYRQTTLNEKSLAVYPQGSGIIDDNLFANGALTTVRTIERNVWFSGCFTYYLNLGRSHSDRLEYSAQQAKRLYGVRLTPDVLWNLAPWSWAADWVTNIGDVLHNLSAFSTDGLVMRYGYVMEHQLLTESRSLTGIRVKPNDLTNRFSGSVSSRTAAETYTYERKIRRRATPFGFGLDPGSFTTRQWSILASLGITRSMR